MVIAYPRGIYLKIKVITRREFELTHSDVAVQHNNHYVTVTSLNQ